MAGKNTTGLPKTEDYNLGRGRIYLAELDATTGLPLAYRDVGNVPEFNVSLEVETLEHQSSRQGLKVVDKEVVISQKANISFQFDEINFENLALFLSGETASFTNPAFTASITAQQIAAAGAWSKGAWYELRDSNGDRLYDLDSVGGTLSIEYGATPTAMTINTHYTVDYKMGMVFIKAGAPGTPATDVLQFDYASAGTPVETETIDEVRGLTQSSAIVALKFISENPADEDHVTELQVHKISLKSEGDLALIGDEWTTGQIQGAAEKNEDASPDSPTMTLRTYATAKA